MKVFLPLIIYSLSHIALFGQLAFEKRMEFELKDGYTQEQVFGFGKTGFMVRSRDEQQTSQLSFWRYELFDSEMQSVGETKTALPKKYRVRKSATSENHLHTLFTNGKGNFSIASMAIPSLKEVRTEGAIPKKAEIGVMKVLDDQLYIALSVNAVPFLMIANWQTGQTRMVPIRIPYYGPKKTRLQHFQIMENLGQVLLFVQAKKEKRKSDTYVLALDRSGQELENYNLTRFVDQNLISISASWLGRGEWIFTGTYSTRYTHQSEGLFFCQVENQQIEALQFYNFLDDLEDFLDYLPEKQKNKIVNKKTRRSEKGKTYNPPYHLAGHDLIPVSDGYLFLGEAFFATYESETCPDGSTTEVFDGYQYTHAVLAKFDALGGLEWDQTFEMWPAHKPHFVKQFITMTTAPEQSIDLVFANGNEVISKSIQYDGTILKDASSNEMLMIFDDDQPKSTFSNLDHWYDEYFIAYGRQKVKNVVDDLEKRKRKVYFISKLKPN